MGRWKGEEVQRGGCPKTSQPVAGTGVRVWPSEKQGAEAHARTHTAALGWPVGNFEVDLNLTMTPEWYLG